MRHAFRTAFGAFLLVSISPFGGVTASGLDATGGWVQAHAPKPFHFQPWRGLGPTPGPPDLWRQREQAYDAIFTREHRIIYDANLAAQNRQAAVYFSAVAGRYRGRMTAYYWTPPRGSNAPPLVRYYAPPEPTGHCGTFQFWIAGGCADARYQSRYANPYKWRF